MARTKATCVRGVGSSHLHQRASPGSCDIEACPHGSALCWLCQSTPACTFSRSLHGSLGALGAMSYGQARHARGGRHVHGGRHVRGGRRGVLAEPPAWPRRCWPQSQAVTFWVGVLLKNVCKPPSLNIRGELPQAQDPEINQRVSDFFSSSFSEREHFSPKQVFIRIPGEKPEQRVGAAWANAGAGRPEPPSGGLPSSPRKAAARGLRDPARSLRLQPIAAHTPSLNDRRPVWPPSPRNAAGLNCVGP